MVLKDAADIRDFSIWLGITKAEKGQDVVKSWLSLMDCLDPLRGYQPSVKLFPTTESARRVTASSKGHDMQQQ